MTKTIKTPLRLFHPSHKEKHMAAEQGDYLNSIITVEISPAGACNQNCIFCSTDETGILKTAQKDFFTNKKRIKSLVDNLIRIKIKGVVLSGIGDPLCRKVETFYFIELLSQANIETTLVTNGIAIKDEDIEDLLKLYAFRITLSSGKDNYKDIHFSNAKPVSSFENILQKIKKIATLREKGIGSCNFFGVTYVVVPQNIHELPKTYKILSKITGLDGLVIKIAFANKKITWTKDLLEKAKKVINETVERSKKEKKDFFAEVYHPDRLLSLRHVRRKYPVVDFSGCLLLRHRLFIDNEGRVLSCVHQNPDKNPESILGNLKKTSLLEIVKNINQEKINKWGKCSKFCLKGCAYHDRNLELQRIQDEVRNYYKNKSKVKHFSKSRLDDILVNFI